MKKILITGASSRAASRVGESNLWGANNFELISPGHSELDVTDLELLKVKIDSLSPDYVINFAGITDLNVCENERLNKDGNVWRVNVKGTKNLADLSKMNGFHLIQISTASVFAGEIDAPGPYFETSTPESDQSKLSWYGLTKLEAEKAVQEYADKWTILRLASTVRSSRKSKQCLFRRWVSQYKEGSLPPLFNDQKLNISDLTKVDTVLAMLIKNEFHGTYHLSSPDINTPYEIAGMLLKDFVQNDFEIRIGSLVQEIEKGNEKFKLFCPQFWGLDSNYTSSQLGITFNSTQESIKEFLDNDLAPI